jgi:hypothetical protein
LTPLQWFLVGIGSGLASVLALALLLWRGVVAARKRPAAAAPPHVYRTAAEQEEFDIRRRQVEALERMVKSQEAAVEMLRQLLAERTGA